MRAGITFAIPFYSGAAYLKIAIESVLAQRGAGAAQWQLLVRDDGERDLGIADLVAEYRHAAPGRITYHRNEHNLGMVRNWNRCIDDAETDLVTLLHADDRVQPDYADTMLELADSHPEAAAYFCDASIINASGKKRFSTADAVKRFFVPRGRDVMVLSGEASLRTIMAGNFVMCPTLCLRKSRLGDRRFSESWKQVQDLEFTSRLLMDGDSLVGSRRRGYEYRRHAEAATTQQSDSRLRFDEEFALFDAIGERAEGLGWSDAARVSRRKSIIKLHLAYRSLRDLVALRPSSAVATLRYLRERW